MTAATVKVLLVGTQLRNLELLAKFIEKLGYYSLWAQGLDQLDKILEAEEVIDLVLIDVTGFDESIWQRCQCFHKKGSRMLIISHHHSLMLQKQGIALGVSSVLVKPLAMLELTELIRALLS